MAVLCRNVVRLNLEPGRELAAPQIMWCILHRQCSNDKNITSQKAIISTPVTSPSPAGSTQCKLMEFFDDAKNWHVDEVKVGRAWTAQDLRIKSNQDLHKLWFVLLKERNMLLTMEHECNNEVQLLPNAERRDKVEISMENLESVVRERNRAYFELETGESGERPQKQVYSPLGLKYLYKTSEHVIPRMLNRSWREKTKFGFDNKECSGFLRLYREKIEGERVRSVMRKTKLVQHMLRTFPDINMEALRAEFPEVDIDKAKEGRLARGNHNNNS